MPVIVTVEGWSAVTVTLLLSDEQLDGEACVGCGGFDGPQQAVGVVDGGGPLAGCEVFAHVWCVATVMDAS